MKSTDLHEPPFNDSIEKYYGKETDQQAAAHDELIPSEVVARIAALETQVAALSQLIVGLNKAINKRIEWEEDVTNSGIQLTGTTRVKKQGRLLAINTQILGQNAVATITTVIDDNNTVLIINAPWKFVE